MFFYKGLKYKVAYTLAEVLVVLAILAVMVLALPPIAKKTFKVKTVEKKHGRVECFYDNSGNLKQYEVSEGHDAILKTVDPSTGCTFYPPSNATYIMIHAVGGGGAGYSVIGTIGDSNNTKDTVYAKGLVNNSSVSTWPDWFKYLKKYYSSDIKSAASTNSYEIKKSFTQQKLLYGLNGQPGDRVSMFFPSLSSKVLITMKPGTGALSSTSNGQPTNVYFKYPSDDSNTLIITASGGNSGTSAAAYSSALSGGVPTDFGVGSLQSVKLLSSTFEDVLETADSYQKSKVNENATVKAGWGGNGAYFYLGGQALNGSYSYQVNNYSQSSDDDDNLIKTDYWQTVTSKIPVSFYKRNGQTGNCTLTNGDIQISGSCYKTTGTANYTCVIKDGSSSNTVYGNASCDSGSCLSSTLDFEDTVTNISSLTNCKFDKNSAQLTCTKTSVANAIHSCTYTDNNLSNFSCPEGISANTSGHSSGYGICSSNSGGNGAVVILW